MIDFIYQQLTANSQVVTYRYFTLILAKRPRVVPDLARGDGSDS